MVEKFLARESENATQIGNYFFRRLFGNSETRIVTKTMNLSENCIPDKKELKNVFVCKMSICESVRV